MPTQLESTWPCWRLWVDHHATWTELETLMSITDVMDANSALGYWVELEIDAKKNS